MAKGETIKLYLIDGSAEGLTKCTVGGWTGVAYKIPRTSLDSCQDRSHLKQTGIYILFGKSDEEERGVAYIGQASSRKTGEGILNRLHEHIRNPDKDYWTEAVAFTTVDDSLGQTEICYLEHEFYEIAKKANRYIVKNGNNPNSGNIEEEKESELEKYIEYAKLILGALGHKLFDPLTEASHGVSSDNPVSGFDVFYLHRNKDVIGKRTSDGFVVLAGSPVSTKITQSLSDSYRRKRDGLTSKTDSKGNLKEDILFSSPSAAATIMLGSMANGNTEWETESGKPLKDSEV